MLNWVIPFAVSGVWAGTFTLYGILGDCAAQAWEVKLRRMRPRGRDCSYMDCGRTMRFCVVPGALEGLIEGFILGWMWNDWFTGEVRWPSWYVLGCFVADAATAIVVYPLSFLAHGRPLKRNFFLATGVTMLCKFLLQLILGFVSSNLTFWVLVWTCLSYIPFSTIMYRGAYPDWGKSHETAELPAKSL